MKEQEQEQGAGAGAGGNGEEDAMLSNGGIDKSLLQKGLETPRALKLLDDPWLPFSTRLQTAAGRKGTKRK